MKWVKPIEINSWDSGEAVYQAPMSPATMQKSTNERVNFLQELMEKDDIEASQEKRLPNDESSEFMDLDKELQGLDAEPT